MSRYDDIDSPDYRDTNVGEGMVPTAEEKRETIARARAAWLGIWPEHLTSGVMFYEGMRITREAFEERATVDRKVAQ